MSTNFWWIRILIVEESKRSSSALLRDERSDRYAQKELFATRTGRRASSKVSMRALEPRRPWIERAIVLSETDSMVNRVRRINVLIHRASRNTALGNGIQPNRAETTYRVLHLIYYVWSWSTNDPSNFLHRCRRPPVWSRERKLVVVFSSSLLCRLVSFLAAFPSSSSVEKLNLEKVLSSRVKVATTRYISWRYGA